MKSFILLLLTALSLSAGAQSKQSIHQFTVTDIDGKPFDLAQLKGKKVLVVNTASKCGFTDQYKDLEALYQKYKDRNFIIIGFPANDFLRQEPGTDAEIKSFCSLNYNVSFPMMSKISVKGKEISTVYAWLQDKKLNGVSDATVSWNFNKFLIDEQGQWVRTYGSKENPLSEEIQTWIEGK